MPLFRATICFKFWNKVRVVVRLGKFSFEQLDEFKLRGESSEERKSQLYAKRSRPTWSQSYDLELQRQR
jgi:hypothetical protein